MRNPSWLVLANLVAAVPFGWALGVVGALVVMGRNIGQLPVMTVPGGIVVGFIFAVWPRPKASTRFAILLSATVVLIFIGWMIR